MTARAAGPVRRGAIQRPAGDAVLIAVLALVGLNLRTTMASLPPLLADVQRDLGLSAASTGLLTGLPVACMGLAAPAAHRLARAYGPSTAVAAALAALTGGLALRLLGTTRPALATATLLAGAGIAVLGTVLPGVVKQRLPARAGTATAAYAGAMTAGSALAAGLAVPLADLLGSWTRSLAIWAIPAAAALVAWLALPRAPAPAADLADPKVAAAGALVAAPSALPWRSRTAWLVAGYLTAQSVVFYSCLAWLAPAHVERGGDPAEAGLLLSAFGTAQLIATLALPAAADRVRDHRRLRSAAVGATAAGLATLLAVPGLAFAAVTVLGAGLGAGFALGLLLLVDHAATPAASTRLSAMAFLVSYTVAAWGPTLTGALRDATGGFQVPFAALLVVSLVQLATATRLAPPAGPRTSTDTAPTRASCASRRGGC